MTTDQVNVIRDFMALATKLPTDTLSILTEYELLCLLAPLLAAVNLAIPGAREMMVESIGICYRRASVAADAPPVEEIARDD